jgi:hypothetical protein
LETEEEGRGAGRSSELKRADWEHTEAVGHNRRMGFNPFRQQRRRTTDYVFVAAALLVVTLLLVWAMLPA